MASLRENDDDPWSSSDDEDDDDEDIEIDDDGDRLTFRSICSYSSSSDTLVFDTLDAALQHDVSHYGFDLLSHLPSPTDDGFFEGAIILINKCRKFVHDNGGNGSDPAELGRELNDFLKGHRLNDEDDAVYYKPVLEDDSMLMCIDDMQELKGKVRDLSHHDMSNDYSASERAETESETIARLQAQISLLEANMNNAKTFIASLANDDDGSGGDDNVVSKEKRGKGNMPTDNDSYYFSSYSNTSIHETMLRDTIRTAAYERAILENSESLFRGKTVLDIGCGTGVLSLFAAKAGAKKVIAVDNSDILNQAKKIVELNGYDNVVTCARGKIEDLIRNDDLPLSVGETVDIIVSEWMGYALFFETMLPSVMAARDAIMSKSGTMYPNVSKIYIEGANDGSRLSYWDDVHSLNMAPMRERMVHELTQEAWVDVVEDENIVTNRSKLIEHDLNKCRDDELDFEAPFELHLRKDVTCENARVNIHQLIVSFDIDFSVSGTTFVSFSTGCQSTPTHWKQTVLWFDPDRNCPSLEVGESLKGLFRMKRNSQNHRAIDMAVLWETGRNGADGCWMRSKDGTLKRSLIA